MNARRQLRHTASTRPSSTSYTSALARAVHGRAPRISPPATTMRSPTTAAPNPLRASFISGPSLPRRRWPDSNISTVASAPVPPQRPPMTHSSSSNATAATCSRGCEGPGKTDQDVRRRIKAKQSRRSSCAANKIDEIPRARPLLRSYAAPASDRSPSTCLLLDRRPGSMLLPASLNPAPRQKRRPCRRRPVTIIWWAGSGIGARAVQLSFAGSYASKLVNPPKPPGNVEDPIHDGHSHLRACRGHHRAGSARCRFLVPCPSA